MSGRGGSGSFGSGRTAGYAIGEGRTSPWLEAIAGIRGDHVPGWAPSPCRLPGPVTRYGAVVTATQAPPCYMSYLKVDRFYLKVVNYRPQALCNLHSGSYDRGHGATTLHSPHQARTRRDRNLATEPPQGISSSSSRISRRLESSRRSSRSSCCTSKA